MENILSEFKSENLDIKLTNEKLFIKTETSNETFALRSVNGIGVIDLVIEYNEDLTKWEKTASGPYFIMLLGALFILGTLLFIFGTLFGEGKIELGIVFIYLGLGVAFIIYGYKLIDKIKKKEPKLMSAIRIMMNSGNRDFQFDKDGNESKNIAEFVAKVESTLTSYHKNNL
jgi:hypothetical protein